MVRALPTLAALALASSVLAAPTVGSKAPELVAKELNGKPFRLSQFQANRPVLVNFFSVTWGSCREEYPHLSELQKKYGAKGFKVISVSIDEGSSSGVSKFVKEMKPAFKVVHDPNQKAAAGYGVTSIPANYVIGRDGKMIAVLGYDLPGLQKAVARATAGGPVRASR